MTGIDSCLGLFQRISRIPLPLVGGGPLLSKSQPEPPPLARARPKGKILICVSASLHVVDARHPGAAPKKESPVGFAERTSDFFIAS